MRGLKIKMNKINKMLKESEENIEYEIYIQVTKDYNGQGKIERKYTYVCERVPLTDDENVILESGFNEYGAKAASKLSKLLRN